MTERKTIRCEVYSRVVGYFRPVQNWNDGKRQEFSERVTFNEVKELSKETAAGSKADAIVC